MDKLAPGDPPSIMSDLTALTKLRSEKQAEVVERLIDIDVLSLKIDSKLTELGDARASA